jgi:predicted DNA-binding protein (MmcQ/YjbR family)
MTIDILRDYCLSKAHATEEFPFDEHILAFKVAGKLFALTDVDQFTFVNLKCDPEKAVDLRERFEAVQPGYHMNKKHWNTVSVNADVSHEMILQMVDDSYELVIKSLTKKQRNELALG